ncbi:MAG: SPOR domain-containing protein [Mariprofundus sp.]
MTTDRTEPTDFTLNHLQDGLDDRNNDPAPLGQQHEPVLNASDTIMAEPAESEPFAPISAAPHARSSQQEHSADTEPVRATDPLLAAATDRASAGQPNYRQLPIIIAGCAALLAFIAIILNLGGTSSDKPMMAITDSDSFIGLEQRINALEALNMQQQTDKEQLSLLQEQVTRLEERIVLLAQRPARIKQRPATKPAVIPVRTTTKKQAPVSRTGGWVLNLAALQTLTAAKNEQARLQKSGLTTEITPFSSGGKKLYRVHSPAFDSKAMADAYKSTLASKYGIKDAWAQKR